MDWEQINWNLEPFSGIGPLRFGMTQAEVALVLGPWDSVTRRGTDALQEYRDSMLSPVLSYSEGKLASLDFGRRCQRVFVGPVDYFGKPNSRMLTYLLKVDPELLDVGGELISTSLGICCAGLLDEDEDDNDKMVTAYSRTALEAVLMLMRVYTRKFVQPTKADRRQA